VSAAATGILAGRGILSDIKGDGIEPAQPA